ncbi:unnamed protein product [Rotaria socialis]|uniref:Uncharacterized protein n=1 Tax=Rotaria socialis TaxID=392032 RepID=A0A818YFZ0_9BILA|nr:unnamed protein product [Rotaria socialis]
MIKNVINGSGQSTSTLIGYVPDLIDILQSRLKFIPNIELVPINQTYASLAQAIEDGTYDLVIGDVAVTATRRQKTIFRVIAGPRRVGLYMLSIVLIASYTTNLASDLTILKVGKIPSNRIGIIIGSAIEHYYLREVSGGSRKLYPLKFREKLYDSLLNYRIDAGFHDAGGAEYVTNNIDCSLTLVGESFEKGSLAMVTPKQWFYGQGLDVNILSLK